MFYSKNECTNHPLQSLFYRNKLVPLTWEKLTNSNPRKCNPNWRLHSWLLIHRMWIVYMCRQSVSRRISLDIVDIHMVPRAWLCPNNSLRRLSKAIAALLGCTGKLILRRPLGFVHWSWFLLLHHLRKGKTSCSNMW